MARNRSSPSSHAQSQSMTFARSVSHAAEQSPSKPFGSKRTTRASGSVQSMHNRFRSPNDRLPTSLLATAMPVATDTYADKSPASFGKQRSKRSAVHPPECLPVRCRTLQLASRNLPATVPRKRRKHPMGLKSRWSNDFPDLRPLLTLSAASAFVAAVVGLLWAFNGESALVTRYIQGTVGVLSIFCCVLLLVRRSRLHR
jgi:hypothetical protein